MTTGEYLFFGTFAFLFGAAIGSFLNVVIYRVPAGLSVVHPPSRCPTCEQEISPRDNIPIVSWLVLRGRCRGCGTSISPRYLVVEALTGVLFVLMLLHFGLSWALPAYLYLVAVGVALAFIDYDTKRLPDVLTLPSYAVALVLLLLPAILDGDWTSYLRAVLGGLALLAFYFVVWFIRPDAMGFGDVKFAGVLGIYLGWLSWGHVALGGFLGFLLGAVGGVALMAFTSAGRKTKVPFGPFMIAGAGLTILLGQPVIDWYASLAFGS
ncbi:prepilin peptidase [Longivirga aurantiaca]|uniref:Prepilin leader peptidase/N-methyltransferase n=1 Tax=Longivirga aurantiaca TaxID=1837743 RepID=A0ABW1T232_9ACTN